jgi:hypothetical protein
VQIVLPVAIIMVVLCQLFHYCSNYFHYYLHYFKTGNSNMGKYKFIAEQKQAGSNPYTTLGINPALSKCSVQALAHWQRHRQHWHHQDWPSAICSTIRSCLIYESHPSLMEGLGRN